MPYTFREDPAELEPQPAGRRGGKPPAKGVGTDLLDEPSGGSTEAPPARTVAPWILWLLLAGLAILSILVVFGLFT